MDEIIFKNVRCFRDQAPQKLGKLTFLVGENSTGKSTFLALVRLGWDVAYGHLPLDFNEPPFALGAYDQIAHFQGGKSGRAKDFTIGLQDRYRGKEISYEATFREGNAQPVLAEQSLKVAGLELRLSVGEPARDRTLTVRVKTEGDTHTVSLDPARFGMPREKLQGPLDWRLLFFALRENWMADRSKASPGAGLIRKLEDVIGEIRRPQIVRPQAIAPVRTKPRRTYDPVRDTPDPEGGHIPMVLSRLSHGDPQRWSELKRDLDGFGKASGLFQDVEIRPLGGRGRAAAAFQVQIKVSGPLANLVDVGYGVSQVLPIVVDSLSARRGTMLLIQQPEVHLHPRAQAELGSFLAATAKATGVRFVLETHSDHLINRVRMEVRDKRVLDPEDVSILYFDREELEVGIHRIRLDTQGNLLDVPEGYRDFFLSEEYRLLGVES